jgi:hypothetical protein
MKILLLGFFSTVGDLEVLEVLTIWLKKRNYSYDIAAYDKAENNAIEGAIDIFTLNPSEYTHLVIVCGPFLSNTFIKKRINLNHFSHCVTIGFNLSIIESLEKYNPFDYLMIRDYNEFHKPDASFLCVKPKIPVFGICLTPKQNEYKEKQQHESADKLFFNLITKNNFAAIKINTQWPISNNGTWINSPEAFESVCCRLDVMLTTRLHGMVLALKSGIPVIAIDPIRGGAKVKNQGKAIGWPYVFCIDEINEELLIKTAKSCLLPESRELAKECGERAKASLENMQNEFYFSLHDIPVKKSKPILLFPEPTIVIENKSSIWTYIYNRIINKLISFMKKLLISN